MYKTVGMEGILLGEIVISLREKKKQKFSNLLQMKLINWYFDTSINLTSFKKKVIRRQKISFRKSLHINLFPTVVRLFIVNLSIIIAVYNTRACIIFFLGIMYDKYKHFLEFLIFAATYLKSIPNSISP